MGCSIVRPISNNFLKGEISSSRLTYIATHNLLIGDQLSYLLYDVDVIDQPSAMKRKRADIVVE